MEAPEVKQWFDVHDKTQWDEGPWTKEPDKVQWVDPKTGLDCLIVRGPAGALCGYVGVPEGHPFFQIEYSGCTLREKKCEKGLYCGHSPAHLMEVHGGLTFSDLCQEGAPEGRGVCHVPIHGRPEKVWWLGFDCAHAYDVAPSYTKYRNDPKMKDMADLFSEKYDCKYRDLSYVTDEVTKLAKQLHAVNR